MGLDRSGVVETVQYRGEPARVDVARLAEPGLLRPPGGRRIARASSWRMLPPNVGLTEVLTVDAATLSFATI